MVKKGVVDLAATADWTPATGDTKISKDGGNVANTTNNPAAVGGTGSVLWTLTLTATELTAAEVQVQIVDSATKAVEDQVINIYTYGNASAKIVEDLSVTSENQVWDALRANHTTAGSVGLLPRGIASDGTATAGAAGSITLPAAEPTTVDIYKGAVIAIYAGTGAGQARMISAYSAGRVATVVPNWITAPDATSKYIIHGFADPVIVGSDNKVILSTDTQSGVTIPTVTTLTNAPADPSGVTTLLSRLGAALTITGGKVDVNDKTGFELSAGGVQAIWDALTSALTTANSIGKKLADWVIGTTQTGDSYARLGAPVGASISADIAANKTVVDAIKAKSDLLPEGIKKNTSYANFLFMMLDSTTGAGKTGIADGSFTKKESIDGATPVSLSGTITEVDATNMPGWYKISFTSGELNGDNIALRFSATGAKDTELSFKTSP